MGTGQGIPQGLHELTCRKTHTHQTGTGCWWVQVWVRVKIPRGYLCRSLVRMEEMEAYRCVTTYLNANILLNTLLLGLNRAVTLWLVSPPPSSSIELSTSSSICARLHYHPSPSKNKHQQGQGCENTRWQHLASENKFWLILCHPESFWISEVFWFQLSHFKSWWLINWIR